MDARCFDCNKKIRELGHGITTTVIYQVGHFNPIISDTNRPINEIKITDLIVT